MADQPKIINRGRGPELEGTRITVYTILEYVRAGYDRHEIAALLRLTSRQVQVALDYIQENEVAVNAEYEAIMERLSKGNPPRIEEKLEQSRRKLLARLAERQNGPKRIAEHAGDHVGQ